MHPLIKNAVEANRGWTRAIDRALELPVREGNALVETARLASCSAFDAALAHADTLAWPTNSEYLEELQARLANVQ